MSSDAATWTVRELKRYLHGNGINTRGYTQKNELIELATNILYENQRAEWIKNVATLSVICITVLLLNVYIRPKLEKVFWLNPKWLLSWIILHCLLLIEKLLLINVILSWILPSTLKQYNLIDLYLVKKFQLFPISVPLNYDTQTQDASMWIDLYPMLLIYLLRKLKDHITMYYHYNWYEKYRQTYYEMNGNRNEENQSNNNDGNNGFNMDRIQFMDDESDEEFNEQLQQALLASMEENNDGDSNTNSSSNSNASSESSSSPIQT